MGAEQSLREGHLAEALTQLQQQVRSDPSNAKHRIFLFQLLCVLGQWERALTQLNVAGDLDPQALPMVQTYREALRCEALRGQVFEGRRSPVLFGEPEPWMALLVQALGLTACGHHAQAAEMRASAFDEAPSMTGSIDGQEFSWISDADSRLGPVLEAVVGSTYYWVPLHRVREIRLEKPADLRDLVWTPAQFVWENGGTAVGLIPTRYAGSESSEDGQVRLARTTLWEQVDEQTYLGLGQRVLATDAGEYPLLDTRVISLNPSATEGANA